MKEEDFKNLTNQGEAILQGLARVNAEKAEEIRDLQEKTRAPTLESLEELLVYIQQNIPSEIRGSAIGVELIRSTHRTASVLDVPYEDIKNLFDKYGIQPPIF